MESTVTVITVTRHRVNLLQRAINSVRRQDWKRGALRHLIIVDECDETCAWLSRNAGSDDRIAWKLIRRQTGETSGPSRLARLRNMASQLTPSQWIAFLDDDNEFEPNHIRTLLACARHSGCAAVHSYRRLFRFDGSPYLEQLWPWCRQENEGRERYREYVAKGILVPGSNVVRERLLFVNGRPKTVHIDMNVWLLRREVLLKVAMSDHFTDEDWAANLTEDDKLLEALTHAQIAIANSAIPSVRYYMGGYSNNFRGIHPHSELWERPSTTGASRPITGPPAS